MAKPGSKEGAAAGAGALAVDLRDGASQRIDTDRVDYRGGERLGQRRKRPFLLWLSTSMGKFDAQEKVCCKQEAVVSHPAIVRLLPANGSVCSLIRLEVGREALAEVLARLRPNHGFA